MKVNLKNTKKAQNLIVCLFILVGLSGCGTMTPERKAEFKRAFWGGFGAGMNAGAMGVAAGVGH